jgi:hypothetical protein
MFLKVSGILMIIGGSIGMILGIIAVIGVGALVLLLGPEANAGFLKMAAFLALFSSIVSFIAGIVGVKNAAKPEKAMTCIVYGFLVVGLTLLGNILYVAGGSSFNSTSLVIGLILPALYLFGAYQNKNIKQ